MIERRPRFSVRLRPTDQESWPKMPSTRSMLTASVGVLNSCTLIALPFE